MLNHVTGTWKLLKNFYDAAHSRRRDLLREESCYDFFIARTSYINFAFKTCVKLFSKRGWIFFMCQFLEKAKVLTGWLFAFSFWVGEMLFVRSLHLKLRDNEQNGSHYIVFLAEHYELLNDLGFFGGKHLNCAWKLSPALHKYSGNTTQLNIV